MTDIVDEPQDGVDAAASEPASKPAKPPKAKAAKAATTKAKAKGKGGLNLVVILVPIALIAAGVLLFTLPPTHAFLANGPLKPLLSRFDHDKHKSIAGKNAPAADPASDVKKLNDEVEAARKAAAAKDAQIAALQSQVAQSQASPQADASPGDPAAKPSTAPTAVPEDVKRTASYWAGMDADKAAEIIKQLPDAYVKSVFRQMPADAVADIMSELPAKTAARLTTGDAVATP